MKNLCYSANKESEDAYDVSTSLTSLSWRRGEFPWSRLRIMDSLQLIDKVFEVPVCRSSSFLKSVEIPQLQLVVFLLGQCCCMPVVCNDSCLVVQSAENFEGFAVEVL